MTRTGHSDLVRIIYRSRSCLEGTASEVEASLGAILQAAQSRNADAGVTGALMFTQLMFIQVLEGRAEAVEAVFERISCDLRHTALEVVEYRMIEERGFGAWSMRHLVPESEATVDEEAADDATEAARLALTLMRALLKAGADDAKRSSADAA